MRRLGLIVIGTLAWTWAGAAWAQPQPPGDATGLPPVDPDFLDTTPLDLEGGSTLTRAQVDKIKQDLLKNAQAVPDPVDRSLALVRAASGLILTNRLDDALRALVEAGDAAILVEDRRFHDLRILAVLRGLMTLSSEFTREGMTDDTLSIAADPDAKPRDLKQRMELLDKLDPIILAAELLTGRLHDLTYRSELRHFVAEQYSIRALEILVQVNRPKEARSDLDGQRDALKAEADHLIQAAVKVARLIERPVWRDQALFTVAVNAATGEDYQRAIEIARSIPSAEMRAEAQGRLGDLMARSRQNDLATATFQECARSLARIPVKDARNVLTGILIQALVGVGRFDDARASVVLFDGDPILTAAALGLVAESQGQRGLGEDARKWIAQLGTGDPKLKGLLERKVVDGELRALSQNRSQYSLDLDAGVDDSGPREGMPQP